MTDTFVDANGWTGLAGNPYAGDGGTRIFGFWTVLAGNAAAGGITATPNAGQTTPEFCGVLTVASGTPTWAISGSIVNATGNATTGSAGNITTNATSAAVFGIASTNTCPMIAGSGASYTRDATSGAWSSIAVERAIVSSAGPHAVDFGDGGCSAQAWAMVGVAFEAQ